MKLAVLVLTGALLATGVSSCSDGSGQPSPSAVGEPSATVLDASSVEVVLEADISVLPAGADPNEVMNDIADILQRRATASDIADFEIEIEGTNRLSAKLSGVDPDDAKELLEKTGQLVFSAPVVDEEENVVCQAMDSTTYAEPFQPGAFVKDDAANALTCPPSEDGVSGVVTWEPATAIDSQGEEQRLTGAFLRPTAKVVDSPPSVLIEFTGEGALLFEQITSELVHLPLAIFLDHELISAPTVQTPIDGGQANIAGLDIEQARTLAIQINAGALPAPVSIVSIEETP